MVGFPGETKEDFEKLYGFVKEAKFDRLGAFSYSKEEGTPAEKLDNQIHPMTKKSRYNKIMSLQQQVIEEKQKELIGKEIEKEIIIMTVVSMNYLLEAGVHFGHQKRRWNPKMREYRKRIDIFMIELQNILEVMKMRMKIKTKWKNFFV